MTAYFIATPSRSTPPLFLGTPAPAAAARSRGGGAATRPRAIPRARCRRRAPGSGPHPEQGGIDVEITRDLVHQFAGSPALRELSQRFVLEFLAEPPQPRAQHLLSLGHEH